MMRTIFIVVLFVAWALPTSSAELRGKDLVIQTIIQSMPPNWKLAEKAVDQLPWGHYWGYTYLGEKGISVILEGPRDVLFHWRGNEGNEHREPLAKETLELWFMPPDYHDTWKRYLKPHRPIPATLVYSGKYEVIYGRPSHRITSLDEFRRRLKEATQTSWPDSPHNAGSLSWANWKNDIEESIRNLEK